MGAHLVSKALATWATLVSDKAFRVLMRMSLTALDESTEKTEACLYFDHPDSLGAVMGSGGTPQSRLRQARRGIEELIGRGALERVNRAKTGSRQVYRLTLWGVPRAFEPKKETRPRPEHWEKSGTESSDVGSPPGSDSPRPPGSDVGSPEVRTWGVHPRNQEEPREELREEYMADLGEPVHGNVPQTQPQDEDQHLAHPPTTDKINHETPVVDLTAPPTTHDHSHIVVADPRCSYHGLPNTAPASTPHRCRLWKRDGMCGQPKPPPLDD